MVVLDKTKVTYGLFPADPVVLCRLPSKETIIKNLTD